MNDKNYNIIIDANVSTDDRKTLEKVGTKILKTRQSKKSTRMETKRRAQLHRSHKYVLKRTKSKKS